MQMNLEAMTWDTLPCLQQHLAIEAFSVKCFNYRGIIDMLAPTIMRLLATQASYITQ